MINIEIWMNEFLQKLNYTFGKRVWFVGLQGSYARGEETETSDIDVVVILDKLSVEDIQDYNVMLNNLSHRDLICGFLSGKDDIMNWDTSELFQFCHDTIPFNGSLNDVISLIDENAVNRAIKTGVCNIFHGCIHNMLHENSDDILRDLYKSASFIVQAIVFKQMGKYIKHQEELLSLAMPNEQNILNIYLSLKKGGTIDFITMSNTLFIWSQTWINQHI